MKKLALSLLAGCMLVSAPLMADAKIAENGEKFRPDPWSDCGLGAMVAPKNKTAAIVSNIIWDFGVTGMTSAASSEGTCKGNNVKVAKFVEDRYDLLEEEVAKGGGTNLTHVMNMLDCSDQKQEAAITHTRAQMGQHALDPDYKKSADQDKKADLYFSLINAADKSCGK